MTIEEFADIIGAELVIRRYANQNNRYSAEFDDCEISDGPILMGSYGDGVSPKSAVDEYIQKIMGRTLVFNAFGNRRREYNVPHNLEGIKQ